MVLMVFFNSRISPRTSTVIFFDRSPVATAVVTSAIFRTWAVKLPAIEFPRSVKSFQCLRTASRRGASYFRGERTELVHHGVDRVLELRDFAFHIDRDLFGEIAIGDSGGNKGNVSDLCGKVTGHKIHAVGQVFPGAGNARHFSLAAEDSFRTHFAGHTCYFRGE